MHELWILSSRDPGIRLYKTTYRRPLFTHRFNFKRKIVFFYTKGSPNARYRSEYVECVWYVVLFSSFTNKYVCKRDYTKRICLINDRFQYKDAVVDKASISNVRTHMKRNHDEVILLIFWCCCFALFCFVLYANVKTASLSTLKILLTHVSHKISISVQIERNQWFCCNFVHLCLQHCLHRIGQWNRNDICSTLLRWIKYLFFYRKHFQFIGWET